MEKNMKKNKYICIWCITCLSIYRETFNCTVVINTLVFNYTSIKRNLKKRQNGPVCKTAKETQICRADFWTQRERERVGWFGRMALKHVYYHVRIQSPVYVWCRIQHAWGWCTGMTQRDVVGKEVGGGLSLGSHVHPWWIHVNVWQNQYSIVK